MGVLVGDTSRQRQRARKQLVRLDGVTRGRTPSQICTGLGVAFCIVVSTRGQICTSMRTRPPLKDCARPLTKSASAPSAVNLAPTKIRQVRRPAKLVRPIHTALLKLQVVTTTPPAVQPEHVLAELQLVKVLCRRWCTKVGRVEDARMGVLVSTS